jgi:phage gpG-like protein
MKLEFDRAKIMTKVTEAARKAVYDAGLDLQSDIRDRLNQKASNISNGGIPSSPGSAPANSSGTLMRSITTVDVTTDPLKPHSRVGTNVEYSRIQEYGGRIQAKKGKFLAVPVGIAGRRAAREANGNLRSLDLTLLRARNGKLMLVKWMGKKGGKGSHYLILFILKKSVYLPPRPYMRPAYEAKKTAIRDRVSAAIGAVLNKFKGAA